MKKILVALILCICFSYLSAARKALVIGNAAYQDKPLKNTINDALDVREKLRSLDFTVTYFENASLDDMHRNILAFTNNLDSVDEVVVYYAGHGVQIDGENYLIPVSPPVYDRISAISSSYRCSDLLLRLERPSVAILFLDACRNNPYSWARSLTRGLASMEVSLPNQCVVFSTQSGKEALDGGESDRNSPFAEALVKYLDQPLDFDDMIRNVKVEVAAKTGNKQIPYKAGDLMKKYYFVKEKKVPTIIYPPVPEPPKGITDQQNEEVKTQEYGSLEVISNQAGDIYIDNSDVAYSKITANSSILISQLKPGTCKITFKSDKFTDTKEVSIVANQDAQLVFTFAAPFVAKGFIQISGGSFTMGSKTGDESPEHLVTINPFQISSTELTVSEFNEFVAATNYRTTAELKGSAAVLDAKTLKWKTEKGINWKNPSYELKGNLPVTFVSWFDAINYCNWRSAKENLDPCYNIKGNPFPANWSKGIVLCDFTANGYRLPTEAEWEFAARANNPNNTYSGDNDLASVGWTYINSKLQPNPVGSLKPNEFGLYDLTGNVYEWCWDWYDSGYYRKSAKQNPTGNDFGKTRIVRGGAWYNDDASHCRISYRNNQLPETYDIGIGFRLVKKAN